MPESKAYAVFLKGNEVFEIETKSRAEAVQKAKHWFYRQIEKGEIKKGVRVRNVLSVSDPYLEVKFNPKFNTNLDINNFLKPEDVKRIINNSKGALAKTESKESGPSQGHLRQLKRTKAKAYSAGRGKYKRLECVPYIHTSKSGALFYAVQSFSVNKRPATRYLKLESKSLVNIIEEIRDRRLVKKDQSKHAKEKLKILTRCIFALSNLKKAMSYFSWTGITSLTFHYDSSLKVPLRIVYSKLYYNPRWGNFGQITFLNSIIRKEFLRNASESFESN